MRQKKDIKDRLLNNVEMVTESGCWIWLGCITVKGYGMLWAHGKVRSTHRVSYEAFIGPIKEGLHIDHLCRVRCCINPTHLEPVKPEENKRRGIANCENAIIAIKRMRLLRTHCKNGHEICVENTRFGFRDDKYCCRICKLCQAMGQVKYREKKKRDTENCN